jgi:hypothetical protein
MRSTLSGRNLEFFDYDGTFIAPSHSFLTVPIIFATNLGSISIGIQVFRLGLLLRTEEF